MLERSGTVGDAVSKNPDGGSDVLSIVQGTPSSHQVAKSQTTPHPGRTTRAKHSVSMMTLFLTVTICTRICLLEDHRRHI